MVLEVSHDPRLLALSVIIAAVFSYTALSLGARASRAEPRARGLGIAGGAFALAAAAWSLHFVTALGSEFPGPIAYHPAGIAAAMLPALLGAGLCLHLVTRAEAGEGSLIAGGALLGAGALATHHAGSAATLLAARAEYDPTWLGTSAIIGIVGAAVAVWIVFRRRAEEPAADPGKLIAGSIALAIAIAGLHFVGMAAVVYQADATLAPAAGIGAPALATAVAAVAVLVMGVALAASLLDRRAIEAGVRHTEELDRSRVELESKVEERTRHLREAVGLLKKDIAARTRIEAALAAEKERVQVTLNSMADAVITTDKNGNVDYMNPVAERMTGWAASEAHGRNLAEVVRLFEDPRGENAVRPLDPGFRGRSPEERGRYILLRRDGRRVVVEESTALLREAGGAATGTVIILHDVTQAERMADELRYHASHDPLTGLVNRREFERRLQGVLRTARESRTAHALAYIDLDQFKVINDVCGHLAGDALLRELSAVLRERVREGDTLARLGGDEFGVLLDGCPLRKAEQIAETLRSTIDEFTFNWGGRTFTVGASIGVVPITFESDTVSGLLSAADVACYAAKDMGRNRVRVYHPSDEELARRQGEMHWVAGVNRALQQNRFCLFAQNIRPLTNGRNPLPHREILIRIVEKDGTLIPPGAFIPPAERYDLMPKVDRWVVSNLLTSLAEHYHPSFGNGESDGLGLVSVNLSGSSVNDEMFVNFLRDRFRESGISPEHICFEINETTVTGSLERAKTFIRGARDLGCKVALDNFGSGMSSLTYLKALPVDFLKIDGGFVRNVAGDEVDQTIIEAIARTGHTLGMSTIAEMVEQAEALDVLRNLGVDFAQGMAVSPPRPLFQPEAVAARQGEDPVPEDLTTTLVGIPRPS